MDDKSAARLFSYVVRQDAGFAPNVEAQTLTLACCKPRIRATARVGDWVLGTHRTAIDPRRVCFLAEVRELLTFDAYYRDDRFLAKRATRENRGDNIYHLDLMRAFIQEKNRHHTAYHLGRDTSVDRVIVGGRYWYFGERQATLSEELLHVIKRGPGHKIIRGGELAALLRWAEQFPSGTLAGPLEPVIHKRVSVRA